MRLVLKFFKQDALELSKQGIKIEWLGVKDGLDPKIIEAIEYAVDMTKDNQKVLLVSVLTTVDIARLQRRLNQLLGLISRQKT